MFNKSVTFVNLSKNKLRRTSFMHMIKKCLALTCYLKFIIRNTFNINSNRNIGFKASILK